MRTIKVNIRRERQRYESLEYAIKNGTEVLAAWKLLVSYFTLVFGYILMPNNELGG